MDKKASLKVFGGENQLCIDGNSGISSCMTNHPMDIA
jgi:hypothetical protein